MDEFIKGEIVKIPFPFSDLSAVKIRPALIIANLPGDDQIACAITSQAVFDDYAVPITDDDLESGFLFKPSNIRPNKLFTADSTIIRKDTIGMLKTPKMADVITIIEEIIES